MYYLVQVGPEVDLVLRHYVKQGAATVLSWQLPLKSQVKVCTEAQITVFVFVSAFVSVFLSEKPSEGAD